MDFTLKVKLDPAEVMQNHGIAAGGPAQRFLAENVRRRIVKYMPYRTGALIKRVVSISDGSESYIYVPGPYARYLYYGKVMANAKTGKGPAYIPGIGYRWTKGVVLAVTDRDINYDTSHNPLAGPFWDRRLMAAEREMIAQELQNYKIGRAHV